MRISVVAIIVILNFILQSTIFKHIEVFSISPNTAIIIIVSFSILRYEIEGAIIGFFSGLLQDIFFGNVIGLNALLYMLIGYACGKPYKIFYKENYLLPLILVFSSTVIYNFSYYILNFFFQGRMDSVYYLRYIIIPETIYNITMCLPIYAFIGFINKLIDQYENPNRRIF